MADVRPEPAVPAPQPRPSAPATAKAAPNRRAATSTAMRVPSGPRYPGVVRVGLLLGGSAALWAGLIFAGMRFFQH